MSLLLKQLTEETVHNAHRYIDFIDGNGKLALLGGLNEYVKRTLSPYFRNLPLLHITIRIHLTWRLLKFMQWLARKQYVLCR